MPRNPTTYVCRQCNRPFLSKQQPSRVWFCSRTCAGLARRKSLDESFWSRIRRTDACWLWTGHRNNDGYGSLRRGDKMIKVHRLSWELHFGTIPDGTEVCHHCDNPACVRPDHLFLGTHLDNMVDRDSKGRSGSHLRRGELNGQSKLTASQVQDILRRYAAGNTTHHRLASDFSVSPALISHILSGRAWQHVTRTQYK